MSAYGAKAASSQPAHFRSFVIIIFIIESSRKPAVQDPPVEPTEQLRRQRSRGGFSDLSKRLPRAVGSITLLAVELARQVTVFSRKVDEVHSEAWRKIGSIRCAADQSFSASVRIPPSPPPACPRWSAKDHRYRLFLLITDAYWPVGPPPSVPVHALPAIRRYEKVVRAAKPRAKSYKRTENGRLGGMFGRSCAKSDRPPAHSRYGALPRGSGSASFMPPEGRAQR